MPFSFINYLLLIFIFIQLISCNQVNRSDKNANELYIKELKENITKKESFFRSHPGNSQFINPYRIETFNSDRFIVVDEADKSIVLMNNNGQVIFKTGGKGRGPGEFQGYIRPHIGDDQRLYVIDSLLFRITVYEITNDDLEHVETIDYQFRDTYHLNSLYVTESGNYAVFSQFESYYKPDNRFLLYRLDKNFEPVEKILELPGNERPEYNFSDRTMYLENIFAERTYWDMDGEWFYYLQSHSPVIKKFNVQSGQVDEIQFPQLDKRSYSPQGISFIKTELDHIDDDINIDKEQYWSVLEESNILPLFSLLEVHEETILLPIFYPDSDTGMILYIEAGNDSEKLYYLDTPHGLERISMKDDLLLGIVISREGERSVIFSKNHEE